MQRFQHQIRSLLSRYERDFLRRLKCKKLLFLHPRNGDCAGCHTAVAACSLYFHYRRAPWENHSITASGLAADITRGFDCVRCSDASVKRVNCFYAH